MIFSQNLGVASIEFPVPPLTRLFSAADSAEDSGGGGAAAEEAEEQDSFRFNGEEWAEEQDRRTSAMACKGEEEAE